MAKIFLYNPVSGSPIKKWYDGHDFWALPVDTVAVFPEKVGFLLKATYGFLQECSPEDFEIQLAKLNTEQVSKIKVGPEGNLVPKTEEDMQIDSQKIDLRRKEFKHLKVKIDKAEDAQPRKLAYWEMDRGALIVELNARDIEVKGLGKKGVNVSKEQLINLLENDDVSKGTE